MCIHNSCLTCGAGAGSIWVDLGSATAVPARDAAACREVWLEDYGYVGEIIHALKKVRQQLRGGRRLRAPNPARNQTPNPKPQAPNPNP